MSISHSKNADPLCDLGFTLKTQNHRQFNSIHSLTHSNCRSVATQLSNTFIHSFIQKRPFKNCPSLTNSLRRCHSVTLIYHTFLTKLCLDSSDYHDLILWLLDECGQDFQFMFLIVDVWVMYTWFSMFFDGFQCFLMNLQSYRMEFQF